MERIGVKLCFCTVAAATAFGIVGCSMMFPSVTPENIQTLRKICSDLPVPSSFTKIRERSLEKPELVIYSAEYTSEESPRTIEAAFKAPLLSDGWQESDGLDLGERTVDFEKGKYSIHIEYLYPPSPWNQKYLVDCGFNLPGH